MKLILLNIIFHVGLFIVSIFVLSCARSSLSIVMFVPLFQLPNSSYVDMNKPGFDSISKH